MTAVWICAVGPTGTQEVYVLAESDTDAQEAAELMGHTVSYVEHYSDNPEDLPS